MKIYERYCLPCLIDKACGTPVISQQRQKIVPLARGRVLEVGIGSGRNLQYYDPAKVVLIWGLEPSPGMRRIARKRIASSGLNVRWIGLRGEEIPLEDKSVDTVLLTYTLCSIPDWKTALQQMKRVLKPEGNLLFSEHGLAPEPAVEIWQHRLTPVWRWLSAGCHLNRPIPHYIKDAGFRVDKMEVGYLQGTPRVVGYHYRGIARPF